jgi:hypothetical protein
VKISILLRKCFRKLGIVGASLLLYVTPSFGRSTKPVAPGLNSIPKRIAAVQNAIKTTNPDILNGKLLAQWGNWANWANWNNWNNWANWANWRNY